uniref:Uncharacterized protein n=1 Tax=Biomphalaria glabrata TaxID=6526 RepID=A0A2C9M120_BIOGL
MMHMKAGDLLDNDCDRRIDEELLDNQDNDGDGQLDEDLALLTVDLIKQIHMIEEHNNRKKVDRKWSKWSEWQCSSNCSDSTQYRHRLCDNPKPGNAGVECPGESEETILEQCYVIWRTSFVLQSVQTLVGVSTAPGLARIVFIRVTSLLERVSAVEEVTNIQGKVVLNNVICLNTGKIVYKVAWKNVATIVLTEKQEIVF